MSDLKYGKIILIVILAIFSIFFLFYFYNMAEVIDIAVEDIKIVDTNETRETSQNFDINLELFKKDKFKKLKAVGVSTVNFDTGKRDLFEKN